MARRSPARVGISVRFRFRRLAEPAAEGGKGVGGACWAFLGEWAGLVEGFEPFGCACFFKTKRGFDPKTICTLSLCLLVATDLKINKIQIYLFALEI
jgi:hypothetical protein